VERGLVHQKPAIALPKRRERSSDAKPRLRSLPLDAVAILAAERFVMRGSLPSVRCG
jgi:hypothetical protein